MNSITHFELPVSDKSKKFYQDLFGWQVEEMPEMNYTIVRTSEVDEDYMPTNPAAVNGGMMSVEENGGTNPVLVIDVPSIDDSVKKIEENGGTIVMPKTEVGAMGYYARFTDPAGVVMGVWESKPRE